jgi:hypothetical protein
MPEYDDTRFTPPAPLASVTLRDPETGGELSQVLLLIDSGADVTLLPAGAVKTLGVREEVGRRYALVGFDGSTSSAPVVRLELIFCRKTFRGQFLLVEQKWGILGRNVLNAVPLLLDGPRLTWDEHRA